MSTSTRLDPSSSRWHLTPQVHRRQSLWLPSRSSCLALPVRTLRTFCSLLRPWISGPMWTYALNSRWYRYQMGRRRRVQKPRKFWLKTLMSLERYFKVLPLLVKCCQMYQRLIIWQLRTRVSLMGSISIFSNRETASVRLLSNQMAHPEL